MPSSYEWIIFAALAVGAIFVLSVDAVPDALAGEPEPELDAVTLVEQADESIATTPIEGTRVDTIKRPNRTERTTVAVAEDPPYQSRTEVIDSVNQTEPYETVVINESITWRYDEDEQVVVNEETDGYWVSDTQTFGMDFREMRETYEFEHAGVETVNGHEAYVVKMKPSDDKVAELSVHVGTNDRQVTLASAGDGTWLLGQETWWIDTETTYPVKQQLTWVNKEEEKIARNTRTYEQLTIDVEHDTDTFEFDPPTNAEITEPNRSDRTRFEDRDTAEQAVPFELPEPELSDEFELVSVHVTERDERTSATLLYYNGAESISVAVSGGEPIAPKNDVVEQNVGEINGTIVATDSRPFITWECGDLSYRVHGPADTDRIVGTAESVGCQ